MIKVGEDEILSISVGTHSEKKVKEEKTVKRIIGCLLLIMFSAGSFMGCAMVVAPVNGGIYTDLKAPVTATSNTGFTKVGTGECTSILGFVAMGDCSISAAMKNGNITKIHHVDHDAMSFLWLYAKYTIRVYGE